MTERSASHALGPDGRYLLRELLGSGGAASVHRAHDRVLDRDVAVKVLHDVALGGGSTAPTAGTARARFVSEARTLAGLDHPHLVALLDAGLDEDQPFLVMQLVEGRTLATAIAAAPAGLDPSVVRAVAAQVAGALAHAHAHGVVHRDVKPANVLLADRGAEPYASLADFGIARLLDAGDATRHTAAGTTVGTAAYLAPEQVRGQDVRPPADVYALGLVLLESLTGRRTYPGTPMEAAVARLSSPPAVPDDVAPDLRDLIVSMTALDPAERPDAEEVAVRLQRAADPPPVPDPMSTRLLTTVTEPVPGPRASPVLRAPALLLGAAMTVVVVALGVAAGTSRDPGGPASPAPTGEPSSSPVADTSPAPATSPRPTAVTPAKQDASGSGPAKMPTKKSGKKPQKAGKPAKAHGHGKGPG